MKITESQLKNLIKEEIRLSLGKQIVKESEINDPDPYDEKKEKISFKLQDLTFDRACEIVGKNELKLPNVNGQDGVSTCNTPEKFEEVKQQLIKLYGEDVKVRVMVKPSFWAHGVEWDSPQYNKNKADYEKGVMDYYNSKKPGEYTGD